MAWPASLNPVSRIATHCRPQLQLVLDREHDAARAFLARGDKARATTALRRRRYQETLLQKTDGQLETLEGLVRAAGDAQLERIQMS